LAENAALERQVACPGKGRGKGEREKGAFFYNPQRKKGGKKGKGGKRLPGYQYLPTGTGAKKKEVNVQLFGAAADTKKRTIKRGVEKTAVSTNIICEKRMGGGEK